MCVYASEGVSELRSRKWSYVEDEGIMGVVCVGEGVRTQGGKERKRNAEAWIRRYQRHPILCIPHHKVGKRS